MSRIDHCGDVFMHTCMADSRWHKNSSLSLSPPLRGAFGRGSHTSLGSLTCSDHPGLVDSSARPAGTAGALENRWTRPAVDEVFARLSGGPPETAQRQRTRETTADDWGAVKKTHIFMNLHNTTARWTAFLRCVKHRLIFLTLRDTYFTDGFINYTQLPLQCNRDK